MGLIVAVVENERKKKSTHGVRCTRSNRWKQPAERESEPTTTTATKQTEKRSIHTAKETETGVCVCVSTDTTRGKKDTQQTIL